MNWAYVVGAILVWLLTTAGTWLIAARITTAVLREQNKNLKESVSGVVADVRDLGQSVRELSEQMAATRTDRVSCELRSARNYATRAEIARLISDQTNQYGQIMSKLDELSGTMHGRVTELAKNVSNLQGKIEGAPSDGRSNVA